MISVISIYNDVVKDNVNEEENGELSYEMFNRLSRRAELLALDFITSDIENKTSPMPDLSFKNRDFLAPFVSTKTGNVVDGKIARPDNYYGWDNAYTIGTVGQDSGCGEDDDEYNEITNTSIELVIPAKFNERCMSSIDEIRPSFSQPICKMVGKNFIFMPSDLGTVGLEYIRIPKFANIITKDDAIHNIQVIDELKSANYEWDESARSLLVWFITQAYAIHSREGALYSVNKGFGKLSREQK